MRHSLPGRPALLPFWSLHALLLLLLLAGAPARAQEESMVAGSAPAPLSGAENVTFVSQAVDARLLRGDDGSYRVSAEGVVRLHNTDRFNVAAVTLGWPGWPGGALRFDPAQIGFGARKGGVPLPVQRQTLPTSWAGETRDSEWLVAQTTIERDARERIFFDWSENLGTGPLLRYSFGLVPASAWPDVVGSARVTLQLPAFASREMIVTAQPADFAFSGDEIEWLLVEEEPLTNPTVTLIAPHIWQAVEEARARQSSDPLAANLQLADLYEELAAAGVAIYAGEAEAALEAARRAAPEAAEPLRRLARLYQARAAESPEELALLEQAADLAEAALAAGASDEEMRGRLVGDLERLAAEWADRDAALALEFLQRAEQVAGEPERFAANRRALAQRLALAALERDDLAGALAVAGANGLPTEVAPLPWLDSARVRVETGQGERVLQLTVSGDPATMEERFGSLATRLAESGIPATWEGEARRLTLRLRGGEGDWPRTGATIAGVLPDEPEWDLLRQVLTPETLLYRTGEDPLAQRFGYRERLRLAPRAAEIAAELRAVAPARESAWEQALALRAAAQWQALADRQSVQYTVRFPFGDGVQREWAPTLPSGDTLEWQGEAPRRDRWLLVGGGAAVALLLLLALIWLPGRR